MNREQIEEKLYRGISFDEVMKDLGFNDGMPSYDVFDKYCGYKSCSFIFENGYEEDSLGSQ